MELRFRVRSTAMVKLSNVLRAVILAAVLCGCHAQVIRVPVLKPAEINMAGYRSVAVGTVTGNANLAMSDSLEEALVGSHRFTVVDRVHMSQLMRELRLSPSDLTDPKSALKLATVIPGGALIFGETSDNFRETPDKSEFKGEDKKSHSITSLKGEVYVRATFKLVDIATGRLIVAKTYEEKREELSQAMDKRPDPVDRRALQQAARQAVVARFMKAIVPHQEYMEAKFAKDSDLPQLESGIEKAQRGEWKEAQEIFSTAAQSAEKNNLKTGLVSKCYWNLGLSYEYAGDYDKASDILGKAYKLSNDSAMLSELDNVKRLQSDFKSF
jgi:tetratricopeptide (TPR) repeat protein